jgi:hypothetical protein
VIQALARLHDAHDGCLNLWLAVLLNLRSECKRERERVCV